MGLIDKVTGKGLAVKTARDMIDGSFRALFRDARKENLVTGDPFAALDWPDKVDPEPDPFTEEERDILLDYYWRKDRQVPVRVHAILHRTASGGGHRPPTW